MKTDIKTPCKHCPFKSDIPPGPNLKFMTFMLDKMISKKQEFPCHVSKLQYMHGHIKKRHVQHCAGAMIYMEKSGNRNQVLNMSLKKFKYDPTKLNMNSPIFNNLEEILIAYKDK